MVATFHAQHQGEAKVFRTVGIFNDQSDPVVFCCRYDWQREISLVNPGDRVAIGETAYSVDKLDVDLNGVATFTLENIN